MSAAGEDEAQRMTGRVANRCAEGGASTATTACGRVVVAPLCGGRYVGRINDYLGHGALATELIAGWVAGVGRSNCVAEAADPEDTLG